MSDRTTCSTVMPTSVTAAQTTTISDAPVGRWTGRRPGAPGRTRRRRRRRSAGGVGDLHGRSVRPRPDVALTADAVAGARPRSGSAPCQRPGARCGHARRRGERPPPGSARSGTASTSSPPAPWRSPDVAAIAGGLAVVGARDARRARRDGVGGRGGRVPRRQRPARRPVPRGVAVPAARRAGARPGGRRRRPRPAPLPPGHRRRRRDRAQAGRRAARQGRRQPAAAGHVDRLRGRAARRRAPGRRELRLRPRRARRRRWPAS